MGKKLANTLLFLAVLAAAVGMTLYVGQGVVSVLVYNFIFLAVMVVIYFICLFGGMYRMNNLAESLRNAGQELVGLFPNPGMAYIEKFVRLKCIFHH